MALACKPEELIISTHTLTWSVTYQDSVNVTENSISTHTLTWSVTQELSISVAIGANFNSHAHVERDALRSSMLSYAREFQLTRSRGA